jgi:hypothetical protein
VAFAAGRGAAGGVGPAMVGVGVPGEHVSGGPQEEEEGGGAGVWAGGAGVGGGGGAERGGGGWAVARAVAAAAGLGWLQRRRGLWVVGLWRGLWTRLLRRRRWLAVDGRVSSSRAWGDGAAPCAGADPLGEEEVRRIRGLGYTV